MKNVLAALVLTVASLAIVYPGNALALNPLTHCGTERWHIKTLDDAGVNHIEQVPTTTTITALRALAVPSGYSKSNDASRYLPQEETKYTVTAAVMGFKEEADRDFHVVIADPNTGKTMIAEIPDPGCSTVQESGHANQISAVRSSFIACFGQPPAAGAMKQLNGTTIVSATGVGFFDFVHTPPQTGVAPNAFELHPLLLIKNVSGKCPTGSVAHCACTPSSSRR